ncbi:MAG: NF038143 family protein [Desulfobacterales bacterium]|nr:NF038143 family protein [Desulfobacterales bacterium]
MKGLDRKRALILDQELAFANAIGAAVFEKPRISYWMVLIPILFLYFVYRMQKFKTGRLKFDQDFMVTRRKAMEIAIEGIETGSRPDIDAIARESGLRDVLEKPYAAWLKALVEHYTDLLSAAGDSHDALVRSAYRTRTDCLLALNRLGAAEKEFYAALKTQMGATEGAADVIATIQERSRQLRRELAERVFA